MGVVFQAECNNCGRTFRSKKGGGMKFYLLYCEQCGSTKDVAFYEIKKFKERNTEMAADMSRSEIVEEIAGRCECTGQYSLNALPRCPKCNSDDIEEIEILIFYD